MKRSILTASLFAVGIGAVCAAPPPWWSSPETQILSTEPAKNYAPVNLGQLKLVAKNAKEYLDLHLPGGAGSAITQMVANFEPRQGQGYNTTQINQFKAANYAPANLGQLKAVVKPFYDRLIVAGYNTRQNLIAHGAGGWTFDYPWDPATPDAVNYAPANIGQLKLVFSFDISTDTDSDGMPDWWEIHHFGSINSTDPDGAPGADPDNDGFTNLEEFQFGLNPRANDAVTNVPELSYDALGRLKTVGTRTYSYDPEGNILTAIP